jgi:thymidylate synthase (FAD)
VSPHLTVLDHGYVRLVEVWGHGDAGETDREDANGDLIVDHECGIIEAARQSTQASFRGWDSDAKLLAYLYQHAHSTPFEFAGMVLEIQAPIFVFREWHRHRTQSYSEMSARYAPLPELHYLPTVERLMMPASGNRQAGALRGADLLSVEAAQAFRSALAGQYATFQTAYEIALACGVPKELARLGMPVARYSRMRASANLRNWLGFLTLRMDPAAQWEIRQFAEAVGSIVAEQFPRTWELFRLGRTP